jgi:hypothetical protein
MVVLYFGWIVVFAVVLHGATVNAIFTKQFRASKLSLLGKDERRSSLCSLRGGATETDKSEKIKGVCIGIDLGTTYRFVPLS